MNKACFELEYKENKEQVLIKYIGKNNDIVIIEDGITEIGEFAFCGCTAKEIILPDSVRIIQQCAFASCKNLEKIVLGKGLEYCDDDIILGSPVQEIVWTKPIESTRNVDFLSLVCSLIREEDVVYHPSIEKKYDTIKRFFSTKRPQKTFLLKYKEKSVRLPRYISSYLHRLVVSDAVYDCLIEDGDTSYEYQNLQSCLSDFLNLLSVITEWYVLDHLNYAEEYLKKHAAFIAWRIIQDSEDETLSQYINLGLLTDKDLQRVLQWASEKDMQTSVAYILEQMRKRGLKNNAGLTL